MNLDEIYGEMKAQEKGEKKAMGWRKWRMRRKEVRNKRYSKDMI